MNRECHGDRFSVVGLDGVFYRCLLDSAIVKLEGGPVLCPHCNREIDYGYDREVARVNLVPMVIIPGSGAFDWPFAVPPEGISLGSVIPVSKHPAGRLS